MGKRLDLSASKKRQKDAPSRPKSAVCPSRKEAINVLDEVINNHDGTSSLSPNSIIYIEGKPKESLSRFKKILKVQGYGYSSELSNEVNTRHYWKESQKPPSSKHDSASANQRRSIS